MGKLTEVKYDKVPAHVGKIAHTQEHHQEKKIPLLAVNSCPALSWPA
jgi:hypothetical protein